MARDMADRRTELHALVQGAHDDLLRVVDSLRGKELARATSNEGWSGKDTLAHLSSIEERLRAQIRCALDGLPWAPAEDIDTYNARRVGERRSWTTAQLREELVQECATTLALLDGLEDNQLDLTFDHPRWGSTTAGWVFQHIAEHMQTHRAEIAAVRAGTPQS